MSQAKESNAMAVTGAFMVALLGGCLGAAATHPRTAPDPLAPAPLFAARHDDFSGPRRDGYFAGERPISLDEFLRIAGHDHRADQIRDRRVLRRALIAGGIATVAGSLAYALTLDGCTGSGAVFTACVDQRRGQRQAALVVGGLGAGLTLLGATLSSRRPELSDLREMARQYNRQLGGDASARSSADAAGRSSPAVRLVPVISADGGGLVLGGVF